MNQKQEILKDFLLFVFWDGQKFGFLAFFLACVKKSTLQIFLAHLASFSLW